MPFASVCRFNRYRVPDKTKEPKESWLPHHGDPRRNRPESRIKRSAWFKMAWL